jgi:hypothetical protein
VVAFWARLVAAACSLRQWEESFEAGRAAGAQFVAACTTVSGNLNNKPALVGRLSRFRLSEDSSYLINEARK